MSCDNGKPSEAVTNGTTRIPALISLPPALFKILADLRSAGHLALLVGGVVRDALLGVRAKDLDVEVYCASVSQLADFLRERGTVDLVGSAFGVIKFRNEAGEECDFSIPRRDSRIGRYHRDFHSSFDPDMTIREAAARRDFTVNSMAYDPVSGELHDYFGGCEDLHQRVLRATTSSFSEDPLRVLRGAQFACRFDLDVTADTAEMCQAIACDFDSLPRERVSEEFMKWATKSARPGRLIEYLHTTGWLRHFPHIQMLVGIPQDPLWHPEGDVAKHTMHVVDAAAGIAVRESLSDLERAVLMFAALTHDLAKATTTEMREVRGSVRWTSYGHEKASGPLAREFLASIGIKAEIIDRVVPLVENHLAHHEFRTEHVQARTARRLAVRLAPANIRELAFLIEADSSGRPPLPAGLPAAAVRMLRLATEFQVQATPEKPLILGRYVLPHFAGTPGKHVGFVVKAAYEAQLDGVFADLDSALLWLSDNIAELARAALQGPPDQ